MNQDFEYWLNNHYQEYMEEWINEDKRRSEDYAEWLYNKYQKMEEMMDYADI